MTAALARALDAATARHVSPLLPAGWERTRVEDDPPLVLYTSPSAFLALGTVPGSDPSVLRLEVRMGPLEAAFEPARGVDLRQIVRHDHPGISLPELNRIAGHARFPAGTPEEVDASVALAAEMLAERPALLAGDAAELAAVEGERRSRYAAWVTGMQLEDVRADAERAWREHDYARAAELLARIPDGERSPAERKRLEIAEKRA
jgi:hypothetical protein